MYDFENCWKFEFLSLKFEIRFWNLKLNFVIYKGFLGSDGIFVVFVIIGFEMLFWVMLFFVIVSLLVLLFIEFLLLLVCKDVILIFFKGWVCVFFRYMDIFIINDVIVFCR